MQIILLEKNNLGDIGSVVTVKNGYARNFLIPRNKAVRATKDNLEHFEKRRAEIEVENAAKKAAAEALFEKVNGLTITVVRQAGEDGRLYGSVTSKDIVAAIKAKSGVELDHHLVVITDKFKEISTYQVAISLHAEVKAEVSLSISRTDEVAA